MKESRIVKICDRCRYTIERKRGIMDYMPIEKDGFHTAEGIYMCGTCYNEFLSVLRKFMDSAVMYKGEK